MSPGSTIRRRSRPVNAVRSACTRNSTSAAAPGASSTRANPVSCRTGRVTCGDHVVQVELDHLGRRPGRRCWSRRTVDRELAVGRHLGVADPQVVDRERGVRAAVPEAEQRRRVEVADPAVLGAQRRLQVGARLAARVRAGSAPAACRSGCTRPVSTPAIAAPPSSPGMNACTRPAARPCTSPSAYGRPETTTTTTGVPVAEQLPPTGPPVRRAAAGPRRRSPRRTCRGRTARRGRRRTPRRRRPSRAAATAAANPDRSSPVHAQPARA